MGVVCPRSIGHRHVFLFHSMVLVRQVVGFNTAGRENQGALLHVRYAKNFDLLYAVVGGERPRLINKRGLALPPPFPFPLVVQGRLSNGSEQRLT